MILLLLLLALAWTAQAQVASGTLLCEVRDESGAVAPGVRITAARRARGSPASLTLWIWIPQPANLFNHPNWGVPGPYPDFKPFFGRILTTGEPRRIQLGLRFDF